MEKSSAINLENFKATNDVRKWMNKLFDLDGYLGAATGHYIAIDTSSKSKFYGFSKFEDHINPKNRGEIQGQLHSIVGNPEIFDWQEMPPLPVESYRECDNCNCHGRESVRGDKCIECDSEGSITFDTDQNSYNVECKSCDGDGREHIGWQTCSTCNGTKKHLEHVAIKQEGLGNENWCLNAEYVRKFSTLPNCQIAWVEEWERYAVSFDNGAALVFPMRQ